MKWQFWKPEIVKYRDGSYAIRKYKVATKELFGQWMYFSPEHEGFGEAWQPTTSPMTRTTSIERVTNVFDVLTDTGKPLTADEVIAEKVTAKLAPQFEPQHDYRSKSKYGAVSSKASSSALAFNQRTKELNLSDQNRHYAQQQVAESKRLNGKY